MACLPSKGHMIWPVLSLVEFSDPLNQAQSDPLKILLWSIVYSCLELKVILCDRLIKHLYQVDYTHLSAKSLPHITAKIIHT